MRVVRSARCGVVQRVRELSPASRRSNRIRSRCRHARLPRRLHWCCHFSVDVRAVEVFSILDFVERSLPADEKARIYSEVRANSAALKGMDEMERMRRNVKCPFLSAGRCSIYEARPQTCRNYHATDVAGCQQSYEDPDNLEIDPEFAPMVYQAGGAHVDAFTRAMREAGYDTNVYEMNSAIDTALSQPDATHAL